MCPKRATNIYTKKTHIKPVNALQIPIVLKIDLNCKVDDIMM